MKRTTKSVLAAGFLALCATGARADERPTGELQEKCQAICDWAVRENLQGALQFVAYRDGRKIVDVWAGTMTTNAGSAKIDGTTLFPIFSTEKPLLATAVHRTVEQGKLAYDQAVSTVWPEFTGGGKEKLTVRELLGYRSGLPDGNEGFTPEGTRIMSDWKAMLDRYASVTPDIVPGTKQRYMAKSYAWAHGGTLEKVWKKPANEVLREQVLIPAGIERDFYFVCGDAEIPRIATAYKSKAFESMNDDLARRSFLPSAWAVSSARGIAQFYNRLCGFDGRPPLVRKETLDEALKPCRHPSDPLPDAKTMQEKWFMIFGMGYGLWGEADNMSRVFGHGGIGGSEGLCDRSQRLTVGFTCNFDKDVGHVRAKLYGAVGMKWRYWKDAEADIQEIQMSTMKADAAKAVRPSVASFCRRAEKGDRLTVAFFGGSLTWGANATDPNRTSWRALIGERLERQYPNAHFKFVDAAIGGTGSNLGVFRLERDVLKYRPDLAFVEWAVNDGAYRAKDDSTSSYEGILRNLLTELPDCVPVQVILPDRKTVELADESKLLRRAEHIAIGEAFGLSRADVLGEMRRLHSLGRVDLGVVWPAVIGDNTHPFDEGYALYADIIWRQVFAAPSDRTVQVPAEWISVPKYRHVLRKSLFKCADLPSGWQSEPCAMRAGTFDFLCSRWQDGLAVAREGAAPLKAKFRGEVLLLYGESAVQSSVCEVYVDGKRVASRKTSDFGTWFAPSAYLVWQIGTGFDPSVEHDLEIRPVFTPGEKKEFRLGSICVAGREASEVRLCASVAE